MSQGTENDRNALIERLPPEKDEALDDRHHTVEVNIGQATELIHLDKCKLVVVDGPDRGKTLVIDKPIVRIGTYDRNHLMLTDNTVSRFHCEIRLQGDEYVLVDRESTNGTYAGELRLREVVLYPNCELLIGNSLVRFEPMVEEIPVFPIARNHYAGLVGGSPRMREVYGVIDKVAGSELTVLIEGETGTGKELIARAIHDRSRRAKASMVIFDCSAFPENLLESELFGHEKGAFSGAIRTHKGVFERADGGTLFLDELGELPLNLQPKFLRALENGEIRRVGGERAIKVDVRVVAATNRNVATLVEEGKFRQDLFYRLAKVRVLLPGLRERIDDLPLLIDHFLAELRKRGEAPTRVTGFAPSALEALRAYDWPGNVRELRNVVERAAAFADSDRVQVNDLPADVQARLGHAEPALMPALANVDLAANLKDAKERMVSVFEREYLIKLLEKHHMNISRVARDAGIDRRHVYRLLKKYEIDLPVRED
jgi:transcriptional regulator with GAF, ATPase, and Fis domain